MHFRLILVDFETLIHTTGFMVYQKTFLAFFLKITWLSIIVTNKKWYFDSKIVQTICDNFFFLHLRKKFRNINQVEGRDQKNNLTSVPQKNVPSAVVIYYYAWHSGYLYYIDAGM